MSYDVIASQPIVIDNVSEKSTNCSWGGWVYISHVHK